MDINNVFWLLGIFVVIVVLFAGGSSHFKDKSSSQDETGAKP